ncbi:MAG: nitronate monooxygenase [Pseudomonadales bacterium]
MKSPICEKLGIEFPLFAFSHCRDVVAAVSKAGGFGVLGAVGHTPETLEMELTWIDEHVDGKPYGVDLIVPTSMDDIAGSLTPEEIAARVPEAHKRYVEQILAAHGIPTHDLWDGQIAANFGDNLRASGASAQLDTAFRHPIRLVVNALGVPPPFMLEGAAARHPGRCACRRQATCHQTRRTGPGCGYRGGWRSRRTLRKRNCHDGPRAGNCARLEGSSGDCGAGCWWHRHRSPDGRLHGDGRPGVWTGSICLTTTEAETHPVIKEKMLTAGSNQTVRSRSRTGKYTRQLRSPWTDAWQAPDAPEPLPMPMQGLVSGPALNKIDRLALAGDAGAKALSTYWVGQGVGLMNESVSARTVVFDFMRDFAEAAERLAGFLDA